MSLTKVSNAMKAASTAAKTANYTVLATDEFLAGDASGGAFTFTLPTPSSVTGQSFHLVKTDTSTNAITISGTIDGLSSLKLISQYQPITVTSDGTEYKSRGKRFRLAEQVAMTRVTSGPAALGEYRSYLRTLNSFTYGETNGTPATTPTAADGFLFYGSTGGYDATDPNNNPTRYDIFVGKNKKVSFEFYASAGRTGAVFVDVTTVSATGDNSRGIVRHYDPTTGIVTVALPVNSLATANMSAGMSLSSSTVTNVYFDIIVED